MRERIEVRETVDGGLLLVRDGMVLGHADALATLRMLRDTYDRVTPAGIAARNATAVPEDRRGGYVYLMTCDGLEKIGVTRDVERRRRQIENGSGKPVTVVAAGWFPDCREVEAMLHDRYATKRREGEWFSLSLAQRVAVQWWIETKGMKR